MAKVNGTVTSRQGHSSPPHNFTKIKTIQVNKQQFISFVWVHPLVLLFFLQQETTGWTTDNHRTSWTILKRVPDLRALRDFSMSPQQWCHGHLHHSFIMVAAEALMEGVEDWLLLGVEELPGLELEEPAESPCPSCWFEEPDVKWLSKVLCMQKRLCFLHH